MLFAPEQAFFLILNNALRFGAVALLGMVINVIGPRACTVHMPGPVLSNTASKAVAVLPRYIFIIASTVPRPTLQTIGRRTIST